MLSTTEMRMDSERVKQGVVGGKLRGEKYHKYTTKYNGRVGIQQWLEVLEIDNAEVKQKLLKKA